MKYRAILLDPGAVNQERPNERFGHSLDVVNDWAVKALATAVSDDAVVNVYQMVEQQIAIIPKRGNDPVKTPL
jgi:hypothetical protein